MNKVDRLMKILDEKGLLTKYRQEGIQQGMQQGVQQLIKFLKSGHTLEEAEKKFAFA